MRSFFSFISISVAAPTLITATPPASLASLSCNFSRSKSEVVVVEGAGEGYSEARTMEKAPDEKERLKAAELLGKRYGLYTEKIEQEIDAEIKVTVDYGDEDNAED